MNCFGYDEMIENKMVRSLEFLDHLILQVFKIFIHYYDRFIIKEKGKKDKLITSILNKSNKFDNLKILNHIEESFEKLESGK